MLLLFLTLGLLAPLTFYVAAEHRKPVPLPLRERERRRSSTKLNRPNH